MAITSAFQAADAGSIPASRSKLYIQQPCWALNPAWLLHMWFENGPIAQSVEQVPHKVLVAGSNPAGATIFDK